MPGASWYVTTCHFRRPWTRMSRAEVGGDKFGVYTLLRKGVYFQKGSFSSEGVNTFREGQKGPMLRKGRCSERVRKGRGIGLTMTLRSLQSGTRPALCSEFRTHIELLRPPNSTQPAFRSGVLESSLAIARKTKMTTESYGGMKGNMAAESAPQTVSLEGPGEGPI